MMDDHETPQRVLGKKGKKSVKVGKIVLIVDPTGSKTGEKRWRVSFVRRENANGKERMTNGPECSIASQVTVIRTRDIE